MPPSLNEVNGFSISPVNSLAFDVSHVDASFRNTGQPR
jgi:hypothetical protein